MFGNLLVSTISLDADTLVLCGPVVALAVAWIASE